MDVTETRPRGRPKKRDRTKTATLHVRVNPDAHDRMCRMALRLGLDVNTVARRILENPRFSCVSENNPGN